MPDVHNSAELAAALNDEGRSVAKTALRTENDVDRDTGVYLEGTAATTQAAELIILRRDANFHDPNDPRRTQYDFELLDQAVHHPTVAAAITKAAEGARFR